MSRYRVAMDIGGTFTDVVTYDAEAAHSAIYDAEKTADLYCLLVNEMQPVYARYGQRRNGEEIAIPEPEPN